MIKIGFNLAD